MLKGNFHWLMTQTVAVEHSGTLEIAGQLLQEVVEK